VLALWRLLNCLSRGRFAFGKGSLISDPIFDNGDINVVAAGPCADIDRLKADGPDPAKKDDDTDSDEEEMRRG
jgi:hypothetical protein